MQWQIVGNSRFIQYSFSSSATNGTVFTPYIGMSRRSSTSQIHGAVGIGAVGIGRGINAAGISCGIGRGVNAAGVGRSVGRGSHIGGGSTVGHELRLGGSQSDDGEQAQSELKERQRK